MKIARRCFLTSYAVFFFPQFSTLITLPPSRWTMPRMRSTILSTRSSARSGRTRKMVSYSRSMPPCACCAGPPVVCGSTCCITSPHGGAPEQVRSEVHSNNVGDTMQWCPLDSVFGSYEADARLERLSLLPGTPVVLVRRHPRPFPERRQRGIRRQRDQLLQCLLFLRGELRQYPVRPFPLLGRPSHSEPHPHRISGAEVLPEASQPVVPRVASALLHLQPPELQVDLVVHHHDLVRRHLPEPRRLPHRLAAQVHVPLREQHRRVVHLPHQRIPARFRSERRAQLARRLLGDAKADVVAGALVLRPRVSQADPDAP